MTTDEAIKTFEYYQRQHDRGLPVVVTDRDTVALDMAIESLKQNQWIPCSERLPEVGEDVFISVGGDVWEAHLRASKEYFLIHSGRMLVKTEETDAWMPLPKAYEGGTE